MKLTIITRLSGVILVACLLPLSYVMAQDDSNTRVPFEYDHFSSCAGEENHLSGELHARVHTITDGKGGYHLQLHLNHQGASGIGVTSGSQYRVSGAQHFSSNVFPSGETWSNTYVSLWRLVGTGKASSETLHLVFKVTVNANGGLTALVDHSNYTCG